MTLRYCDLIPGVFNKSGELKELLKWRAQIVDDFFARMTSILTLENTLFFIHTIETLISAKSKFDFIQGEINQLEDKWEQLSSKNAEFANFEFPSEEVYNRCRYQYIPHAQKVDIPPTS